MPDKKTNERYLSVVKSIGFDGMELGFENFGGFDATQSSVMEIQKELENSGVPCVAIRAGGGLAQPKTAKQNRKRLEKSVEIAGWIGASVVNSALGNQPRNVAEDSGANGAPTSHGGSQTASPEDYERTAKALHEVGEMAGANGVNITIEVHQHSIADNSWSTLHLLDLANSPYVFANPDLGNVLWTYEEPEETSEQCISALASRSKYWHCKNLHRINIPELNHSYYVRVALPDGDIDYRFALNAMVEAKYDGYLAIEGATSGDQLSKDRRSVEYVKQILRELGE
jgi:sugar phosphate isomerase/epimerase